jgi:hypothetical protein
LNLKHDTGYLDEGLWWFSSVFSDKCEVTPERNYVIKRHHEDVWRSGSIAPPLLTLAIDGGEWAALYPHHFTPRKTAPVHIG